MLTKEQNDRLTRVGPETPAGELLRRYWHPVSVAAELTDKAPTKCVRVLGEDLVLFRDKGGNVGLVADRCPHRGASLSYGRVEKRGIACAYHGWLFNTKGDCLETPAEPAESKFHLTVKVKSYPVQKFVGLYWTYMGPQPVLHPGPPPSACGSWVKTWFYSVTRREMSASLQTDAPTAAPPSPTAGSKRGELPAPTTVGSSTPRGTAWRLRRNPRRANFT